ncbi:MAG: hypothetical protein ABI894_09595 [Ilumatobacteraceae bacterium]
MRLRREVTLTVISALLVACSAAASAPPDSHDPMVNGVGILPVGNPDALVIPTDAATVSASASTTTTIPSQPAIGTLVAGNKLLMIGDSITASAAKRYGDELCQALVPLGWQVEVDAEPSRFVDFGNDVLDKRLAAKWDAAYVFLGTNYLGDQEAYRRQLEKIVQRLSPSPVVLLTVTLFDDSRQEVNDAITLVSAEFPNVHVVDWGSIAAAEADKILRGDGHHLTNDGRLVLASTVAGVMGEAPSEDGKCLSTSFSNDSGASVNGSDTPSKKKVGGTTTTVKQPTVTTVGGGGGGGGAPTTQPAQPPPATTVPQPTSPPPTAPPPVTNTTVPRPRVTTIPPPPPNT